LISRSDALKTAINWWSSDAIAIITFSPFLLLYVAPRVILGGHLAGLWLGGCGSLSASLSAVHSGYLGCGPSWSAGRNPHHVCHQRGNDVRSLVTHAPGGGLPRLQLAMLALELTSLCVGTVVTEGMRAEVELEKRARLEMFGAEIGTVLTRSGNLAWRHQTLCGGLRPSPRRSLGPGLVTRRLHQASSARSDYLSRRAGFFCVPKECNLLQVSGGLQNWKSSVTPSKL